MRLAGFLAAAGAFFAGVGAFFAGLRLVLFAVFDPAPFFPPFAGLPPRRVGFFLPGFELETVLAFRSTVKLSPVPVVPLAGSTVINVPVRAAGEMVMRRKPNAVSL